MLRKERAIWIAVVALAFLMGVVARRSGNRTNQPGGTSDGGGSSVTQTAQNDTTKPGRERKVVRMSLAGGTTQSISRSPDSIHAFAMEALGEPNTLKRFAALSIVLENMTEENWRDVKKAFIDQTYESGRLQYEEWIMFLQRAGEVAGQTVADELYKEDRKEGIRAALTGWAITDPKAAVDWLETVPRPGFRDAVWGAAVRGVAMSDPDLALRLLEQLEVDQRASYTNNLMSIIVQTAGVEGASEVFDKAVQRAEANGELEGAYLRKIFYTLITRRLKHADLPDTEAWARQHMGQPYVRNGFYFKTTENLAREDPENAMAWLEDAAEAGFSGTNGFGAVINGWLESRGPDAIGEWLNANPGHPHRDKLAGKFALKIADDDPTSAAAWLESIQDPAVIDQFAQLYSRITAPPEENP